MRTSSKLVTRSSYSRFKFEGHGRPVLSSTLIKFQNSWVPRYELPSDAISEILENANMKSYTAIASVASWANFSTFYTNRFVGAVKGFSPVFISSTGLCYFKIFIIFFPVVLCSKFTYWSAINELLISRRRFSEKLQSLFWGPSARKYVRTESFPYLSISSWGHVTLPNDLDILVPPLSQCPWQITFLGKGKPAAYRKSG